MKKVHQFLQCLFWGVIGVAALIVVAFETELAEAGFANGDSVQAEFLLTMTMELLTVGLIPLALWMFKSKKVKEDLNSGKWVALRKWAGLRLLIIGLLIVVNTLLYYVYLNASFGYMAIIALICLPFVYPSLNRCKAEVEEA